MKTRRILSAALGTAMAVSAIPAAFAEDTMAANAFTQISIPYSEGEKISLEDWGKYMRLLLRYKDTQQTIPLSVCYDGYMHATVPTEYKNRKVEPFIADEKNFPDDIENDVDYDSYKFYVMNSLAEHGIIKGDEDGSANPNRAVTRAEAAAMLVRMLGTEGIDYPAGGFEDVGDGAWYNTAIGAAKAIGFVKGDTEKIFSPERNVSREEIVTMAANAAAAAGLIKLPENATSADSQYISFKDESDVSDWAKAAYSALGSSVPIDYVTSETEIDAEGVPIDYLYANPKKAASRFEIAEIIMQLYDRHQVYPSQAAVKYGFDKKMPVIDGSTSTYPFTEAVYSSLFSSGSEHPDKPQKHSKSHTSYERLINGEVDMLFASVYPAEDIKQLAADKGVELELIPIAYDAMIFFTNADNPAKGLTSEQITKIYVDNAYTNWKEIGGSDALLYPYCRNNDSGSHAQMERHFLNGNQINEKIRNETTSISMSNVLTDVMGAKTDNPKGYALGYSIYYYFKNMDMFYNTNTTLKLLEIDGVYPSDETIANGTYPLSNNTYIVMRKSEPQDSPARRMAEFMLTEQGQQCVETAGFGRLK